MGTISLILGILSLMGVCVSLVPLLNILNCITLPVALVGAILGLADLINKEERNGMAVGGLILCGLALLIGGARALISILTTGGIL